MALGLLIGTGAFISFVSWLYAPIIYGMEVIIYMLIATGKKSTRGYHWFCMFLLFTTVELIVTMITQMALGIELSKIATLAFNIAITDVFIGILVLQRWYQEFMGCIEALAIRQRIAILFIILAAIVMYGVGREYEAYIASRLYFYMFRIALVLFMVSIIWGIIWFIKGSYYGKFYFQQNQMKEEIIVAQQNYYQTIYEKDKELRSFRHDISSHMGCLEMLLNKQDVNAAKEYLHQMENELAQTCTYFYHVGNEILDTILNQICMRADEKGIKVEVHGELNGRLEINSYDLCTIFSNAISNAIEACEEMKTDDRIIKIFIICKGEETLCRFMNPATYEMYKAVKNRVTRKEDKHNHGFGVKNMEQAVERNDGTMEYLYEEDKIILDIWL